MAKPVLLGMSVSDAYLAATVNAAAVAKHHGVKVFINIADDGRTDEHYRNDPQMLAFKSDFRS